MSTKCLCTVVISHNMFVRPSNKVITVWAPGRLYSCVSPPSDSHTPCLKSCLEQLHTCTCKEKQCTAVCLVMYSWAASVSMPPLSVRCRLDLHSTDNRSAIFHVRLMLLGVDIVAVKGANLFQHRSHYVKLLYFDLTSLAVGGSWLCWICPLMVYDSGLTRSSLVFVGILKKLPNSTKTWI